MAFIFNRVPPSVYDEARDISIRHARNYRENEFQDQMTYIFKQGDLEFKFEIVIALMPAEHGNRETYTCIVLEESLRTGFAGARRANIPFQEEEYQKVKSLVEEGFNTLVTGGGSEIQYYPDREYNVEFLPNMGSAAAKYPGKFQLYEHTAKVYNLIGRSI